MREEFSSIKFVISLSLALGAAPFIGLYAIGSFIKLEDDCRLNQIQQQKTEQYEKEKAIRVTEYKNYLAVNSLQDTIKDERINNLINRMNPYNQYNTK